MAFVKALGVVLLFCLVCFVASRRLEDDFNSEKRLIGRNAVPPAATTEFAWRTAQKLERNVRRAAYNPRRFRPFVLGGNQQFGFIYLQPSNQNRLYLTNRGVFEALNRRRRIPLNDNNHIWPRRPNNTNFRTAKVDYKQDCNVGHSEYQLLHSNALTKMRQGMGSCPRFVLVYSTNLPCMRPRDRHGNLRPNRCLEIIGDAKRELLNACHDAFFYLYTHQAAARSARTKDRNYFQWEKDYLTDKNIIWLHP